MSTVGPVLIWGRVGSLDAEPRILCIIPHHKCGMMQAMATGVALAAALDTLEVFDGVRVTDVETSIDPDASAAADRLRTDDHLPSRVWQVAADLLAAPEDQVSSGIARSLLSMGAAA